MADAEAEHGCGEGSGWECLHAGHAQDPEDSSSRVSGPKSDQRPKELVLTGGHAFMRVIVNFFVLQFSQAEVGYHREACLVGRYGVGDVQQAGEYCPLP